MIYTIGHANLTPADLRRVTLRLDATVIDCRSRRSRRVERGFSRPNLTDLLGTRYEWRGATLGGLPERGLSVEETWQLPARQAALDELARRSALEPRNLLLLCHEEAPGECHRHTRIAMPLAARGVEVRHICDDEVFTARALQDALDEDGFFGGDHEYDLCDEPSPLVGL